MANNNKYDYITIKTIIIRKLFKLLTQMA